MRSPQIRAVLFDFDGTLADSYAAITASVNHVRAGHNLPPLAEPEVRKHVGRGPQYLLEHTVPGGDLPADLERYRAHHPSVMRELTQLLPGAAEAIRWLKEHGLATAVCSNKPAIFTRQLLEYLKLEIDVVLGPDDVPRPKPAPHMLTLALKQLGIAPSDAIYIGDMVVDIETARAAGVAVWVTPTGSETREALLAAQPDRVLEDLGELAGLLKSGRLG